MAAIALGHAEVARSQFLAIEDCSFSAAEPPKVGMGQRLAVADRLDALAKEYEEFPNGYCFRLGQSCSDVSPEIAGDVSTSAHTQCRFFHPGLRQTDYENWLPERTAYNVCMVEFLRRKARDIRAAVFQQGEDSPSASEVLDEFSGSGPSELGANEAEALSADVTWCPSDGAGFAVAVLCKGGRMVVGTPQGEDLLKFRVSEDGAICLWDITSPETCHKITFAEGRLALSPRHQLIDGAFTVVPRVAPGQWHQTCQGE